MGLHCSTFVGGYSALKRVDTRWLSLATLYYSGPRISMDLRYAVKIRLLV